MMIKSMTGYGRGECNSARGGITVEIKTLNNKFFDMSAKLPNGLGALEDRIREYIQKRIKRSRVHLLVSCDHGAKKEKRVELDKELAAFLLKEIQDFQRAQKVKGEVDVNSVITFPGVLTYSEAAADAGALWKTLKKALDEALDNLDEARAREGRLLARDLLSRIGKIEGHIVSIKKRSNTSLRHYKKELSKRVKELSGGIAIDKGRLAQEVAIYAKSCDITEEITRIRSHAENFEKSLRSGGEKGKALDFMAQELMREANTMGAKSSDFQISHHVIKIKSEIEKIREQLKNIE